MKKLLFRLRHRKMKKHNSPLKLYVDQSAARFSHFLAKKEGKKLIRAEYLAEECKDLKNKIDDYGREDSPEDPPYVAEEYEEIKRTVRVNTLLKFAFIISEGAFNYFALKAMFPGRGWFLESIRGVTAIVISLVALYLVEGTMTNHFDYISLKATGNRSEEEERQMAKIRSKRAIYFGATVLLLLVILALGIVREFIIAGGVSVNFWAMTVTIGLAIVIAIVLGIQGAEVSEVIYKYKRMNKWIELKNLIDDKEKRIREIMDEIHRNIEISLSAEWGWLQYLKYWLMRSFDDDDREKTEQEKMDLVYINFNKFKEGIFGQSSTNVKKLKDLEERHLKLVNLFVTSQKQNHVT